MSLNGHCFCVDLYFIHTDVLYTIGIHKSSIINAYSKANILYAYIVIVCNGYVLYVFIKTSSNTYIKQKPS